MSDTPKSLNARLDESVGFGWTTEHLASLVRDSIHEGAVVEYYDGGSIGDAFFVVRGPLSEPLDRRWQAAYDAEVVAPGAIWRSITRARGSASPGWILNV